MVETPFRPVSAFGHEPRWTETAVEAVETAHEAVETAAEAVETAAEAVETGEAVETAAEAVKMTVALESGEVEAKMDYCSEESVALASNMEERCSSLAIELSFSWLPQVQSNPYLHLQGSPASAPHNLSSLHPP